MIARTLGAVAIAVCATGSAMDASTPALKPIDPVALQTMAEGAAKELLLPGAMVLLQTPQGNFALGYGTTEL
ncbi:MAG: D-alanyl-D-alanine carboxypeptidase, partial [Mesorhizobium sp.]